MKTIIISISFVFFSSCIKDSPKVTDPVPLPVSGSSSAVWISCEGNFGYSNADITYYDPLSGTLIQNWYTGLNGKSPGDILQSISVYNGRTVLVVNNSGALVEVNANGIKRAESKGFASPRYIYYTDAQNAYVSDYKSQYISIINPQTLEKKGQIACSGWTEGFIQANSEVWVCNPYSSYMYCINTNNHAISDSIKLSKSIYTGVKDAQDRIWVVSASQYQNAQSAVLYAIDAKTHMVLRTLSLNTTNAFSQLVLNERKDSLFFIAKDVWCLNLNTLTNLPIRYIALNDVNTYGFARDPRSGRFYISDAKDFTARSEILVYNASGEFINRFKAGVNASGFYFK
jgi:hypothetical protein